LALSRLVSWYTASFYARSNFYFIFCAYEDHILSYFLGGSEGTVEPVQSAYFTSTSNMISSEQNSAQHAVDERFHHMPPPTPAVQFYSHHHHHNHPQQQQRQQHSASGHRTQKSATHAATTSLVVLQQPAMSTTSQSSSSSSLNSMAAALVAGVGPGFQPFARHSSTNSLLMNCSNNLEGESPISPAAMIGTPQENLLLPPPHSEIEKLSDTNTGMLWHMDTLSNMNAVNNTNSMSAASTMPPPPPQPAPHTMMASLLANGFLGNPFMHGATTQQQQQQQQQQFMYAAAAAAAASYTQQQQQQQQPVESEEKRAKRLERNRESARKSRRRKKERLLTLGAQVNKLHQTVEGIRCQHINSMVPALAKCRVDDVLAVVAASTPSTEERVGKIIRASGPSSRAMRAVVDFQYAQLSRLTLPSYQRMLFWLSLLEESFFQAGKEEYAKRQQALVQTDGNESPSASKTIPVKVSSKQIGDEIFNGGPSNITIPKKKRATNNDKDDNPNPAAVVYDAARMWPLFCFELRFSVDQEDKFLSVHKLTRQGGGVNVNLVRKRSAMVAAAETSESLGKAVGSISHLIAQREEKSYLGVLNPKQVSKYFSWLSNTSNRERCRSLARPQSDAQIMMETSSLSEEISLHDICKRLNEVLQISSTQLSAAQMD
jgi:hypothetical protein